MPELTQEQLDQILAFLAAISAEPTTPSIGGDTPPAQLGFAAILVHARNAFDTQPGNGMRAAALAIASTLSRVADEVTQPTAGVCASAAAWFQNAVVDMNEGYMNDLSWPAAFGEAAEAAYQYENEEDREAPLRLGEFYRILGCMASMLTHGAYIHKSPYEPTGTRGPESWGTFLTQVRSVFFVLGKWYGCWRAPRVPVDLEPLPPGYSPPFSIPLIP